MNELTLSHFVAYLFSDGLVPGTIKHYLAAVRHTQISLGFGDPHIGGLCRLEYIIKGAKRSLGRQWRNRLPGILEQVKSVWLRSPDTRDAAMQWAASCLCFFGFLQVGEAVIPSDSAFDTAVHLAYGDVRVDKWIQPS